MKQFYIFSLLLVSLFSSAQIIIIPDANFKAELLLANVTNNIAKNSSGNYIKIDSNNDSNIQVSEALQVVYLDLQMSSISSLEGINNFTNLEHLNCDDNQLTSLSPTSLINLKILTCNDNQLTTINVNGLINLEVLYCRYNQLTSLNLSSLTNLAHLSCENNQLNSLNVTNLINILDLYCDNNPLNTLDVTTNTNLVNLSCAGNQLSTLNINSNNLHSLECGSNLLTTLNVSTNTNLNYLGCSYNQISTLNLSSNTSLDELSCNDNLLTTLDLTANTSLDELACSTNQLTTLNLSANPSLKNITCFNNQLTNLNFGSNSSLETLICSNNQLTSLALDNLINLKKLTCNNNQITTLNANNAIKLTSINCGQNQLTSLYIKNGKIEGLNPGAPNYEFLTFGSNPNLNYICADENQLATVQNKITQLGYTNCHVNSYCSFIPGGPFYTIQGQQKFDNENDGCDTTDQLFSKIKYNITNGVTTGSTLSSNSGTYTIPVQSGTHTVTPVLENPSYFNVSPTNVVVNFPTQTSPFTENFCITSNGIHHDVEVSIIPTNSARPGFDATYKIIYKNKGNQVENGIINLQFNDAILDLVSTNPIFTTQTTNNLSFNYSNLYPFEKREIYVIMNVNSPLEIPAVNSGDILNYTVTNTISNTDEMLSDNTFVLNQTVVNSLDPNDKTCLQGNSVGPDKVGEYVHYVIRFENTGTFPAENVVVKDMIDTAKFDVSSLIPLDASHNYETKISGNKVEFIFENINLPFDDANNDGYVAFKIKTLSTLVVGNTFSNLANIYFDYNFPIVTNTATTTIAALNNPSFEFANYFSLYPNPVSNELNINLKSAVEINSIQIYNTIGQLVTVQTGNALKVDVSNLKTGNYFIKINTNEGFSTSQFIKE